MMTHLEPSLITQRCADIVAGIVHCMQGVHASTWMHISIAWFMIVSKGLSARLWARNHVA